MGLFNFKIVYQSTMIYCVRMTYSVHLFGAVDMPNDSCFFPFFLVAPSVCGLSCECLSYACIITFQCYRFCYACN